jgi:NitT/TauT family transport system substrate-binding protein
MLKYALHLQGVDWRRIKLTNAGSPEEVEKAFRAGNGDYVHLQGPAPQQLEIDKVGTIVACVGDALPPLAFSSLMAMPAFLGTERARRFMRAYRRALDWVNDAPAAEVARSVRTLFEGVSEAAIAEAIERYRRLGTWRRDPSIPRDQYEVSMDAFVYAGIFDRRFPYEDVVWQNGGSTDNSRSKAV